MSSKTKNLHESTLQGNLGVGELVFSVVAFAAPLVVVGGQLPSLIVYTGYGIGVAYILPIILWLIFAVPFTTMNTHIGRPGAFYAFITSGINKETGLGGAFVVTAAYFLFLVGMWACLGVYLRQLVEAYGGPTIPWYVFAIAMFIIIGILGIFKIDLSAKVLGVFLLLEVAAIIVFDVVVFAKGGPDGASPMEVFDPSHLGSANMMLAFLFATNSFFGFESAAILREEAKDPVKTVKRATYTAVIVVGTFYFVSALAMVTALGEEGVYNASFDTSSTMFSDLMAQYVAPWMPQVIAILMITSSFATALAQHNTVTRYLYSFGKDGVLWNKLGKAHPKRNSPYIASMFLSVVEIISIFVLMITSRFEPMGDGPYNFFVRTGGLGAATLIFAFCFVCLAIFLFFRKNPQYEVGLWKGTITPIIAFIGMVFILICAVTNIDELIGMSFGASLVLACIIPILFFVGFFYARYLKKNKPEIYQKIGRN